MELVHLEPDRICLLLLKCITKGAARGDLIDLNKLDSLKNLSLVSHASQVILIINKIWCIIIRTILLSPLCWSHKNDLIIGLFNYQYFTSLQYIRHCSNIHVSLTLLSNRLSLSQACLGHFPRTRRISQLVKGCQDTSHSVPINECAAECSGDRYPTSQLYISP